MLQQVVDLDEESPVDFRLARLALVVQVGRLVPAAHDAHRREVDVVAERVLD